VELNGKRVLVLGLARSGAAVARLLHRHGAKVVVNDQKPLESLGEEAVRLMELGIEVIGGGHPEGIVHPGLAFVVKNPGIPYKVAPVRQAIDLGLPVYTEVEIAYRFCRAPMIGITGSNGKTTTTTLVGKMLERAGLKPVVAGNIGRALTDVVEELKADDWLVAELSSFQLMGTEQFRPRIGALLNVYTAHLDYHGTFEEYRDAKYRLFANQTVDDVAVLNWDVESVRAVAERTKGRVFPFSRTQVLEEGVFVKDGNIQARMHGQDLSLLPVNDVALLGEHNLENVLAAVAVCLMAGADPQLIAETARTFRGVEHRTEFVKKVRGVDYYNDSKATNAEAATRAIKSFPGNVVLIAGGLDRGVDFLELVPVFRDRIKHVVALGQAAERFLNVAQKAGVTAVKASGLEEAVRLASEAAVPGDVVLLSPACASWDMFGSFEERGDMFKKAVHTL
jgi:UDP-N-acetylmuramoylalanine--D-glutamate ligase